MTKKTPATILICDDDKGISDLIAIVLRARGYTVFTENNPKSVYLSLKKYAPKLLLLDLRMPGLSGEEIIRSLKKKKIACSTIIVSADKDASKIAFEAGADDFLYKPFDIAALERKVAKYL